MAVRQTSALPTASFRFHLAVDTLAVQLTLPLAGCVEDFHLLVGAPCRAHHKKAGNLNDSRPDFPKKVELRAYLMCRFLSRQRTGRSAGRS
jgi:hypothetical protein